MLFSYFFSKEPDAMDEMIRTQRAVVEEHIRQENAHNWPAVHNTFVQDETAFYDVVPMGARFAGLSGVKDFYQAADAAFPDFQINVWGEFDVPGCSIREVTISGTHKGEWAGVPGTGRRITFQLAAFYIFGQGENAGRILAERIYFDNETVMRQIRGELDASSVPDFSKLHSPQTAAAQP